MPTDTDQVTEKQIEQAVHADIYDVSKEELAQKQKEDNGGSLCTICYVKGCRIGPMGRG